MATSQMQPLSQPSVPCEIVRIFPHQARIVPLLGPDVALTTIPPSRRLLARLPKAIYDDRSGRVVCSPHTQDQWPLPLLCLPLSFTFGVYNGEHLLTDPSAFEEGFTAQSTITIGLASDTALGVRWAARGSASAHNQDAMQVDAPDDASDGARPAQVLLLQQAGYCRASQPASNPGTGTGLGGETTPSPLLSTEDVIALCLAQARTRYTELLELLQAAE